MLTERLNPAERQEWNRQLAVIQKGKEHFWATIEALAIIRKDRLFREEFSTWRDFVVERLGMSKRYADFLILGASTRGILGTIVPEKLAKQIETPWKLRNLSGLTPDKMKEVVEHAESMADGSEITAKLIASSRKTVLGLNDIDEDSETSEEMQAFQDALDGIDAVDGLLHLLSTLGSVEDQATILAEVCPELVSVIRS